METGRCEDALSERRLTMTRNTTLTTFGLLAALVGASVAPAMANQQSDKNNARNLALGGVAVAAYGLLTHNTGATVLGAAGAAIAGSQYEQDRQNQSRDSGRYYHYNNDGGYGRDGYDHNGYNRDGFNRDGYNHDGYNRDGFNRNGFDRDGGSRGEDNRNGHNWNGGNQYRDNQYRNNQNRDNQNGRGWNGNNQDHQYQDNRGQDQNGSHDRDNHNGDDRDNGQWNDDRN